MPRLDIVMTQPNIKFQLDFVTKSTHLQLLSMASFKRRSLKVLKRQAFPIKASSFDRGVSEDSTDASAGSFQLPSEEPVQSYKVFGDPVDVLKYDIRKYNGPTCAEAKTCYLTLLQDTEGTHLCYQANPCIVSVQCL